MIWLVKPLQDNIAVIPTSSIQLSTPMLLSTFMLWFKIAAHTVAFLQTEHLISLKNITFQLLKIIKKAMSDNLYSSLQLVQKCQTSTNKYVQLQSSKRRKEVQFTLLLNYLKNSVNIFLIGTFNRLYPSHQTGKKKKSGSMYHLWEN